jgi:hypothetical protein
MVAVLGRWSGHVPTIITEVGTHMRQCWRFGWLLMPSPATRRRVGAYYRSMAYYGSMRTPKGPQQAIVATAHTIACTVYHLLKTGELYVKQSAGNFEAQCRSCTASYPRDWKFTNIVITSAADVSSLFLIA